MPTVSAVFKWKQWCDVSFFCKIANLKDDSSILLIRMWLSIVGRAHDCLFYCRALFTCRAVAAACVNLQPSSKVHPNRPNVLLLVLKFRNCNIGYWTSILRFVFEKNIPRRTQWKLGKSWLSEHFRRQGFWPGSPCLREAGCAVPS